MATCILCASGKYFKPDIFSQEHEFVYVVERTLAEARLAEEINRQAAEVVGSMKPHVAALAKDLSVSKESFLSVQITMFRTNFEEVLEDAGRFIESNLLTLQALAMDSTVEDIRIEFGVSDELVGLDKQYSNPPCQIHFFPHKLIRRCGELRIGIELCVNGV